MARVLSILITGFQLYFVLVYFWKEKKKKKNNQSWLDGHYMIPVVVKALSKLLLCPDVLRDPG